MHNSSAFRIAVGFGFYRVVGNLAALLLTLSCLVSPGAPTPLTQVEATNRAHQIANVSYRIFFHLSQKGDEYEGKVEAGFELRPDAERYGKSLFLDFVGGSVLGLRLNGGAVGYDYDGGRIRIDLDRFKAGHNVLWVSFRHPFSKHGVALTKSIDGSDGETYIYSHFEPYACNQAFPVFDQPDLKATYELTVRAPAAWNVISNVRERSVVKESRAESRWEFPVTPRFSSYVFALHAGPYLSWSDVTTDGIPLRVLARRSIKEFVARDVEEWFRVTKEGLAYYEKLFGYPYPFPKYDQILIPWSTGAMENVGAVTFQDELPQVRCYRAAVS